MDNLKIYRVEDKYIHFLQSVDSRVQNNKSRRRPYVGIVLTVSSYNYFVPMESPKPNHKNLNPAVYIMPIAGGQYGILGFNNMIPVAKAALIEFDIDNEPDKQYANLLRRQAAFINRNKADVFSRAAKTYFRATTKTVDNFFRKVCCDFRKLERACDRYDPNHKPRTKVTKHDKA